MMGHRMRMFGIGTVAALAIGLSLTDTARADHYGRRSYGRTYYSTSYYSGGCGPAYVAPVVYYPARTYYYSSSYCAPTACEPTYYAPRYYAPSRSVGFSFSYSSGRDRDCDRGFRPARARYWGSSHHGRHRGW